MNGSGPKYISELLVRNQGPCRSLRSSKTCVPKMITKQGAKTFGFIVHLLGNQRLTKLRCYETF